MGERPLVEGKFVAPSTVLLALDVVHQYFEANDIPSPIPVDQPAYDMLEAIDAN